VWRREFTFMRAWLATQFAKGFVDVFEIEDADDEDDDDIDPADMAANSAWDSPMPTPPAPPDGAFHATAIGSPT